jgi:hypothetical protein
MFYTPNSYEWHLFAFDQNDVQERANRWSGGPHLHFVNWLWPTLSPDALWNNLSDSTSTKPKPNGSLHIRYNRL